MRRSPFALKTRSKRFTGASLFPAQDGADIFKRNHRQWTVESGEAASSEVGEYAVIESIELGDAHVFEFFFRDDKHFLLLSF